MKSSKKNPLNLQIGDRIEISATTKVEYDNEENRILLHSKCSHICYVCGIQKKATGAYKKGSHAAVDYYGDSDYEPPCLVVDKYHYLYECRKDITSHSFLVHPTHITKVFKYEPTIPITTKHSPSPSPPSTTIPHIPQETQKTSTQIPYTKATYRTLYQ